MRITAACPESLIADANHLAMCLGRGPGDALTYGLVSWWDEDGNAYSAASWETTPAWAQWAQTPVTRPAWDVDEIIDMAAAERAQAAMVFAEAPQRATPTVLLALVHSDGREALGLMGLVDFDPTDVEEATV